MTTYTRRRFDSRGGPGPPRFSIGCCPSLLAGLQWLSAVLAWTWAFVAIRTAVSIRNAAQFVRAYQRVRSDMRGVVGVAITLRDSAVDLRRAASACQSCRRQEADAGAEAAGDGQRVSGGARCLICSHALFHVALCTFVVQITRLARSGSRATRLRWLEERLAGKEVDDDQCRRTSSPGASNLTVRNIITACGSSDVDWPSSSKVASSMRRCVRAVTSARDFPPGLYGGDQQLARGSNRRAGDAKQRSAGPITNACAPIRKAAAGRNSTGYYLIAPDDALAATVAIGLGVEQVKPIQHGDWCRRPSVHRADHRSCFGALLAAHARNRGLRSLCGAARLIPSNRCGGRAVNRAAI